VRQADIIVVGGGGAGLAASIEAASAGCTVVLLEKESRLGGSTGVSVGAVASSGTDLQRRSGIVDTPQQHFEDLALWAGKLAPRDNLDLRRLLTDNVPETVAWLERLGVVFFGPMPDPLHRVPRLHAVLPRSRAYIHHLSREARRLGVAFVLNARAERLILEGGRVSGVEVLVDGRAERLHARRAVILSAGDYSSGLEFKQRFLAQDIADIDGVTPSSTGDGQRLGLDIGSEVVNGDVIWGPDIRFVAPPRKNLVELIPPATSLGRMMRLALRYLPSSLLRPLAMMFITTNLAPSPSLFSEGAILINKAGRRFVDERKRPQDAIVRQPDRLAYVVFDHVVARKFTAWPHYISTAPGLAYAYLADYRRNRRDIYHQADTLGGLAEAIGVPAETLEHTVGEYNASRAAGFPALVSPPFYALGPARSCIPITDGGLRVNARLEVLDRDGVPIKGLFAAGSTGQGGLLLAGPGNHLSWAFTSGRIAGRNASRG